MREQFWVGGRAQLWHHHLRLDGGNVEELQDNSLLVFAAQEIETKEICDEDARSRWTITWRNQIGSDSARDLADVRAGSGRAIVRAGAHTCMLLAIRSAETLLRTVAE